MPQLSITAFTKPAPTLAGQKRRAIELDDYDYDSEEIEVASPLQVRMPLQNVAPSQAQNKRARILDCVLIPATKRVKHAPADIRSLASRRKVHVTSFVGRVEKQHTSRPSIPKTSQEESSEDELIIPTAKLRKKHIVAKSESDFEPDLGLPHDDKFTDEHDFDASEPALSSEDSSDDPASIRKKHSRTTQARKITTPRTIDASAKPNAKSRSKISKSEKMISLLSRDKQVKGLDFSLPPLHNMDDIYADLTRRAFDLGVGKALEHLKGRPLVIGTMCSGTEAPLLSMKMFRDHAKHHSDINLVLDHAFSAEIEPFKQAFIERNYKPAILFRDITEFNDAMKDEKPMATNAYGAKVPVRIDVDVLIAGTSCIDFSKLNKSQKTLEDDGESAKTWYGVQSYVAVAKPLIVILENVQGAPWDLMISEFEELGYDVGAVHVDSKDFYVPQTRQRGYMVCFNKDRMEEVDVESPRKKWQSLMSHFKRHASSPVSDFLLPMDSSLLREQNRVDDPKREVEWIKCEAGHIRCRQDERLGNARPYTGWQESGGLNAPEHGSAAWYQAQTNRVKDFLDISQLRKAEEYDTRFKTRLWDVSQNVYMGKDSTPFGITGCLTPDGQPFDSNAARQLRPEEILNLQGIAPERTYITTETPREIQSLAGNAMTSTVIGAAILSALIAGHKLFKASGQLTIGSVTDASVIKPITLGHTRSSETFSGDENVDVACLLQTARAAVRRCFCEGGTRIARLDLQKCHDCGHTSCTACGGNPQHNYRHNQELSKGRISPRDAEAQIRSALPLCLTLRPTKEIIHTLETRLKDSSVEKYADLVRTAVEDVVFNIQTFRRKNRVTVTYQSLSGRSHLDLILYDNHAEWQLFVHSPDDLAVNDPLREALHQPVAKSAISGSLFDGVWSWRVPVRNTIEATIRGDDEDIPSWLARCESPKYRHQKQPRLLTVKLPDSGAVSARKLIEGTYRYLPRCGTACESLYIKLDASTPLPMFLFLDPTHVGNPKNDCFVFSDNPERLEYDEVRQTVAHIAPSWRAWTGGRDERTISVVYDADWVESPNSQTLRPLSTTLSIRQPQERSLICTGSVCDSLTELISCSVAETAIRKDLREAVDLGDRHFFSQNSWLFEGMRRHLDAIQGDQWHSISVPESEIHCHSCAPPMPKHKWKLGANGESIQPYEDPQNAAEYERSIKSRPDLIAVEAIFSREQKTAEQVAFGVNLASMTHRLRARLPDHVENVKFSWRLKTDFNPSSAFQFRPFALKGTKDSQVYTGQHNMSVDLFSNQLLSLAWMKAQEAGSGRQFQIEETEQERVPQLGWILEMRAQATVSVRGGICAHHPGFGKTIISLGRIGDQFSEQSQSDLLAELAARKPDLIPSTATLVVCPQSLVDQWVQEGHEKLGLKLKRDMFAVKRVPELEQIPMNDVSNAKLLVVSSGVFSSDLYPERVARFAGVPGPATASGRAFEQWSQYAQKNVANHLQILLKSGYKKVQQHVQRKYEVNIASNEFKAAVPSRRLRGKEVGAPEKTKSNSSVTKSRASTSLDVSTVPKLLLEFFYFNRVILDEFQNYTTRELSVIKALHKDKIWGLSGTPAMGDFYDVAKLADFLGIPLSIGSDSRNVMKQSNIRELRKEMTSFERFCAMLQVPSEATYARQHEIHQNFLHTFVARNVADHQMDTEEHLHVVYLDLAHSVVYTEISQHLNSMEMRLKKSSRSQVTDRDKRRDERVASSNTAEEALSKTAAYMTRADLSSGSGESGVEALVQVRQEEIETSTAELRTSISQAEKGERVAFEKWRQGRLYLDALGDEETLHAIKSMCTHNDHKSETIATTVLKKADKEDLSKGLTAAVNALVSQLLVSNRSLRYIQSVQRLQKSAANEEAGAPCANVNCQSGATSDDVAVSAFCGHLVCSDCYATMKESVNTQCPANGCRATIKDHHLLWKSKMEDLQKPRQPPYGAKIDSAVTLLKSIREQEDQAVLFVQYETQLEEVGRALQESGIEATVLDRAASASSKMDKFKSSKDVTAIVLNASDETATGLNLQNANHVIFLSPLLRDQQYAYDATMAQAIGRVRRHGQQKKIHVHRIVALNTIDVDILEHRERRSNAIAEYGAPKIESPPASVQGNVGTKLDPERVQLVKENGSFSLRPQSWLVRCGADGDEEERIRAKGRMMGWEDFSSRIKFSKVYTENDE